jgi:hypothetical protein
MRRPVKDSDPIALLSALYVSLLRSDERSHEFRSLLALYPASLGGRESREAARVRCELNARVRSWLDAPSVTLSVAAVLLWRTILVEGRVDTEKRSNAYSKAGLH